MQGEFTHSAIANAILAGQENAGIGVKSSAIENGPDFTPIKDEIFFIAMHQEMIQRDEVTNLMRKIRSCSGNTLGYKSAGLIRLMAAWL